MVCVFIKKCNQRKDPVSHDRRRKNMGNYSTSFFPYVLVSRFVLETLHRVVNYILLCFWFMGLENPMGAQNTMFVVYWLANEH